MGREKRDNKELGAKEEEKSRRRGGGTVIGGKNGEEGDLEGGIFLSFNLCEVWVYGVIHMGVGSNGHSQNFSAPISNNNYKNH